MAQRMVFILIIIWSAFWSHQAVAAPTCSEIFAPASASYWRQVVDTKGVRIFIKDSDSSAVEKRWGGIIRRIPQERMENSWRLTRYLRAIVRTVKNLPLRIARIDRTGQFELTPMQALYEHTVVRSSNWVSEQIVGKKKEPAFFARFPVAVMLSMMAWNHIDAYYAKALEGHIIQNVQTHAVTYQHLIDGDFRYRQIKSEVKKGKLTPEEAQQQAYWVEFAYSEYFKDRDSRSEETPTLESEMRLIDHFAFKHLKKVITDGVSPMPGFVVPEKAIGQISEAQKLKLFKINHVLNLRYQLITERVNQTELYEQVKNDPEISAVLGLSFDTPFGVQLQEMAASGKISRDQMTYFLQEDAYWQARFQEWATIGVMKLKKVGDQYTNEPLSIDDIRAEVIAEIAVR